MNQASISLAQKNMKKTPNKFKASLPRHMYYASELRQWRQCPKCSGKLEKEMHSYYVHLKTNKDVESFIMGCDAGYFCKTCSVIVLHEKELASMLSGGIFEMNSCFLVTGLIDIDAIPEDKERLPFEEENNPIPNIDFINFSDPKAHENFLSDTSVLKSPATARQHYPERKIGRNELCYCNSGKKYKKCCLEADRERLLDK